MRAPFWLGLKAILGPSRAASWLKLQQPPSFKDNSLQPNTQHQPLETSLFLEVKGCPSSYSGPTQFQET